jgi:hypothetical protein
VELLVRVDEELVAVVDNERLVEVMVVLTELVLV